MRAAFLIIATMVLANGCSDDKPAATSSTMSQDELKRNCDDAQWKEKNLGLWYSVCRRPLTW